MVEQQLDRLSAMVEQLSLNPGTTISQDQLCLAMSNMSLNEYPQLDEMRKLIKQIDSLTIEDSGIEYTFKDKQIVFIRKFCGLQANNGFFVPPYGEAF
jgi:hypothetical protein